MILCDPKPPSGLSQNAIHSDILIVRRLKKPTVPWFLRGVFSSPGVYAWVRMAAAPKSPINGAFELKGGSVPRRKRLGQGKPLQIGTLPNNRRCCQTCLRTVLSPGRTFYLDNPAAPLEVSGTNNVLEKINAR